MEFSGNEFIVDMLINAGAQLDKKDRYGNTPAEYASKNGR